MKKKSYQLNGYITNLGMYNEGHLVGKYISFPIVGRLENTIIHHFRWMFSFYLKDVKDSNPERALSVKQNSIDYCFVAKRCEDGYRMR